MKTFKAPVPPKALPAGIAELLKAAQGHEHRTRALLAMIKAAQAPAPQGW